MLNSLLYHLTVSQVFTVSVMVFVFQAARDHHRCSRTSGQQQLVPRSLSSFPYFSGRLVYRPPARLPGRLLLTNRVCFSSMNYTKTATEHRRMAIARVQKLMPLRFSLCGHLPKLILTRHQIKIIFPLSSWMFSPCFRVCERNYILLGKKCCGQKSVQY